MKDLRLDQTERHFDLDMGGEAHVMLRVILPSKPRGGWPGSDYTIRKWQVCSGGSAAYRDCSDEEVARLEYLLGEVRAVTFVPHPTLGRVAVECENPGGGV